MTVVLRGHRPGDLQALAELTAVAMPRDVVSEEWLAENVLLDVNFDPDGLVVAADQETGQRLGFVYAVVAARGVPADPAAGFLTIGCVHPDHRRRGIGTRLLRRATEHLAARGATSVTYAGYPQAYFLPGLDVDTYPEAAALLAAHGFATRYTAAAMTLDLDAYAMPASVRDLVRARTDEGYRLGVATYDDLPDAIEFASRRLAPDWGLAIRDSVLRHGQGPGRVLLARDPAGDVVGVSTYGAYRGLRERFGPIGVDESRRGTGLGRALLHLTLTRMRAEGAHSAWFLWTGEDSPAGHLYRSTGFDVVRRFEVMRAPLDARP
ncbi:GNAT family N-acetyltransferase [Isoptericola cucumis]|uniref:GNAT family N-acetyltransferase n=1 Tax=Isoptericola cucumis TaxID=1776856 RepID=UPI00320A4125